MATTKIPSQQLMRLDYDLELMRFKCPTCGQTGSCPDVRVHARVAHGMSFTIPLICPYCPESFRTDMGLTKHMTGMKGKCALTEQANLAAQVLAAKQQTVSQSASSHAKTTKVTKNKAKESDETIGKNSKVQTGRVIKPPTKTREFPRQWRPRPTDEDPTEPCPVCNRMFYNRTGVAKHLREATTGAFCMERLKQDPAIQAKVLLLIRADKHPGKGEWRVRCPWCAGDYERPSGVRAHMMRNHAELYRHVVWVDEEDFPNAPKLVWMETKTVGKAAQVSDVDLPVVDKIDLDVDMKTPDKDSDSDPDYTPSEDSDDEPMFFGRRTNRSRSRSYTPKSDAKATQDHRAVRATAEAARISADAVGNQHRLTGRPHDKVTEQQTSEIGSDPIAGHHMANSKPHVCPWCSTAFTVLNELKSHILKCIGPFAPASQRMVSSRPIVMMFPTANDMWKCPWCPAYFTSKSDVEAHADMMHASQVDGVDVYWFPLDRHVKTKCPCCLFSYPLDAMKTHMAEHHGHQQVMWPAEDTSDKVSPLMKVVLNTGPLPGDDGDEEDKKIVLGSKDLPIMLCDEDDDESQEIGTGRSESKPSPSLPMPAAAATPAVQARQHQEITSAPLADMGTGDVQLAAPNDKPLSHPSTAAQEEQAVVLPFGVANLEASNHQMPRALKAPPAPPPAGHVTQEPTPLSAPAPTPTSSLSWQDLTTNPWAAASLSPTTSTPAPAPQIVMAALASSSGDDSIASSQVAATTDMKPNKPELLRQCVRLGCRDPPLPAMLMCAGCDALFGGEEW